MDMKKAFEDLAERCYKADFIEIGAWKIAYGQYFRQYDIDKIISGFMEHYKKLKDMMLTYTNDKYRNQRVERGAGK